MLLRILVPLDGSPLAERALELTTELVQSVARSRPAEAPLVIVFRAVDPSPWLEAMPARKRWKQPPTISKSRRQGCAPKG